MPARINSPLSRMELLDHAQRAAKHENTMALLFSGMESHGSGHTSFLTTTPEEMIASSHFSALAEKLSANAHSLDNAWFGWLGYGLRHDLEQLPEGSPPFIPLPPLWMTRFRNVFNVQHPAEAVSGNANSDYVPPAIASLHSNMSKASYLNKVERTLEQIRCGAFYQANLTRKFYGEFADMPDRFALFRRLCGVSPAPYSAYLQWDDFAILSSSPECFLRASASGTLESMPIKGSIGRGSTPDEDARHLHTLATSEKDKAENLMIVDLMRNDLSRACIPGSVEVPELFTLTSYATVHHMHSTVRGRRRPAVSTLEAVQCCFPPGSMTGTPKISAMQWCSQMEGMERGLYSGAIGWFGGDGSCDLSVVIRTLILQGKKFEFQVGGAIVADSTPGQEWEETLVKAAGIAKALDIPLAWLREL